jgi:hypothetical protein
LFHNWVFKNQNITEPDVSAVVFSENHEFSAKITQLGFVLFSQNTQNFYIYLQAIGLNYSSFFIHSNHLLREMLSTFNLPEFLPQAAYFHSFQTPMPFQKINQTLHNQYRQHSVWR